MQQEIKRPEKNNQKWTKRWRSQKWTSNALAICCGVVLFVALEHLNAIGRAVGGVFRIFYPVFVGAAIAYVIDPLAKLIEERVVKSIKNERWRRTTAVVASLVLLAALFVILMAFLIPQIVDSVSTFIDNMDVYAASFENVLAGLQQYEGSLPFDVENLSDSIDSLIDMIIRFIRENAESILGTTRDVGVGIFNGVISFILAIYFLAGKKHIIESGKRLARAALPAQGYTRFVVFLSRCNTILVRYIAFDLIDGLIIGVVNWVFMTVMRMPYAVLVSVVVGVTNLAPTFGPIVGFVIGGFILLLINPWYALWFVIFTAVLQTVDGYILKPRLFGEQLGVSSILILVFLIVGGRVLGVGGVLLSIPFAAIAHFVYHDYILARLEAKKSSVAGVKEADVSADK